MKIYKNMEICTDGLGLIIYSNKAMEYVREGEDFFKNEFSTPKKVAEHIEKGDIVGFCTGTSGEFNIKIREGYPDMEIEKKFPVSINLAINVVGAQVSIIDLAWLMEWSDYVPEDQQIYIEEGFYDLTILTCKPDNEIWGNNQEIYIYFNKISQMPKPIWNGVPQLFSD